MTRFRKRRTKRVVLLVVGVWLLAVVVCSGLAALSLFQGKSALDDARKASTDEGMRTGAFDRELRNASSSMGRAHAFLDNPIVAPLRIVPVLGRQVSSVTSLTNAVAVYTDTGADAITEARRVTDNKPDDRQLLLTQLADISGRAAGRVNAVGYGPSSGLIGPVADVRDTVTDYTERIKRAVNSAEAAARGGSHLFSDDGRYLVLAANNAEMRAGSGMFLSAGELRTGGGRIQLGDMRTVGELPPANIEWPPELETNWGWIGRQGDLKNLMMSPRFDVAAPLAAQAWENAGRGRVDGVMVVDPATIETLIAATGPVPVGDGLTVNASNVLTYLLLDQYRNLDGRQAAQAERREGLSNVADAAFGALDRGDWEPVTLARQMGRAAQGRHVLMWARNPERQDEWRRAGVTGQLAGNSLMVNSVNLGGNKLDQYMRIDSDVRFEGSDTVVTVKMANRAPKNGPQYVVGPFPGSGLSPGQYKGVLAINVPGDATGVRYDGNPQLLLDGRDGPTRVIGTEVNLVSGAERTFTLRYQRPEKTRFTYVEPSARIPAGNWTADQDKWNDSEARLLAR